MRFRCATSSPRARTDVSSCGRISASRRTTKICGKGEFVTETCLALQVWCRWTTARSWRWRNAGSRRRKKAARRSYRWGRGDERLETKVTWRPKAPSAGYINTIVRGRAYDRIEEEAVGRAEGRQHLRALRCVF